MDSLTHTVLGACTGQIIAGKQLGKKAMLIGAIVNNLPDLDMIANFWHSSAEALLTHRGITHSIFFMVLMCPVLVWTCKRLWHQPELSTAKWYVLIVHGFVLHLTLDACTAYGTGWFEPFSDKRVSFNLLFILDPFFMLPILIGAIVLLILKSQHSKRSLIANAGLALSCLYLISSISFKWIAHRQIVKVLQAQGNTEVPHFETPTALNNLLWYVVVNDGKRYRHGYYSIFDSHSPRLFDCTSKNEHLLQPYVKNSDVKHLQKFAQNYYTVDSVGQGHLQFSDLRFGQMITNTACDAGFVFKYDIIATNKDTLVKQAEFKKVGKETFSLLYERILSKSDLD